MMAPRTSPARAAALAASLAVAVGCGGDDQQVEVAGPELMGMGADQVMIGLTHNMTREGVLQGELRADTAYVFSDASDVHLRSVRVTFFDERGLPDGRLTADSGQYDLRTGNMEAHGNVVVRDTADGQRLETPRLSYDALTRDLRTDTTFVWTRGGEVVRGRGLFTDPSFSDVRIEQPAGRRPAGTTPPPSDSPSGDASPPGPDGAAPSDPAAALLPDSALAGDTAQGSPDGPPLHR